MSFIIINNRIYKNTSYIIVIPKILANKNSFFLKIALKNIKKLINCIINWRLFSII